MKFVQGLGPSNDGKTIVRPANSALSEMHLQSRFCGYHWQWTQLMRATRDSDNYRGPEKTDRPEWAGLPIEYWVDLEVFEGSPLFEILEDLCGRFPERTRQQHIELIAARLTERGRKGEIGFSLVNGEATTDLTISYAVFCLKKKKTTRVHSSKHLSNK